MWARARDFLLYCSIAVLLVATLVVYGLHQVKAGQTSGLPVKWLGFALMTAFVFGNAIRYSKPFWRWPRLWGLLLLFSLLHFGLGLLIIPKLTRIGLIHFAVATPIEYFVLTACLRRFLNRKED
jgi:hypothetical protein